MRAFGNIIIPRWRHQLTPSTSPLGWSCLNSFDPMLFGIAIGAVLRLGQSPKRQAIPTPALTSLSLNAAGLCLARGFEAEGKPGVLSRSLLDDGRRCPPSGCQIPSTGTSAPAAHAADDARQEPGEAGRRARRYVSAGAKKRVPTESARAGCNRSPTSCRPQWRSSLRGSAPDRFVETRFLKQIRHSWRRPLPQNWMSGLPDQRGLALRATD
jgi:hypothetical protein